MAIALTQAESDAQFYANLAEFDAQSNACHAAMVLQDAKNQALLESIIATNAGHQAKNQARRTMMVTPALPINKPVETAVMSAPVPPINMPTDVSSLTCSNIRLTFDTSDACFSLGGSLHHLLAHMRTFDSTLRLQPYDPSSTLPNLHLPPNAPSLLFTSHLYHPSADSNQMFNDDL